MAFGHIVIEHLYFAEQGATFTDVSMTEAVIIGD